MDDERNSASARHHQNPSVSSDVGDDIEIVSENDPVCSLNTVCLKIPFHLRIIARRTIHSFYVVFYIVTGQYRISRQAVHRAGWIFKYASWVRTKKESQSDRQLCLSRSWHISWIQGKDLLKTTVCSIIIDLFLNWAQ